MNVYTAEDLDDLARLREEVEILKAGAVEYEKVEAAARARLRAERDEAKKDATSISVAHLNSLALAREAAGLAQRLARGKLSHEYAEAVEDWVVFKDAHPELVE